MTLIIPSSELSGPLAPQKRLPPSSQPRRRSSCWSDFTDESEDDLSDLIARMEATTIAVGVHRQSQKWAASVADCGEAISTDDSTDTAGGVTQLTLAPAHVFWRDSAGTSWFSTANGSSVSSTHGKPALVINTQAKSIFSGNTITTTTGLSTTVTPPKTGTTEFYNHAAPSIAPLASPVTSDNSCTSSPIADTSPVFDPTRDGDDADADDDHSVSDCTCSCAGPCCVPTCTGTGDRFAAAKDGATAAIVKIKKTVSSKQIQEEEEEMKADLQRGATKHYSGSQDEENEMYTPVAANTDFYHPAFMNEYGYSTHPDWDGWLPDIVSPSRRNDSGWPHKMDTLFEEEGEEDEKEEEARLRELEEDEWLCEVEDKEHDELELY